MRRNRGLFAESDEELPVLATIASQFADPSIDELWKRLAARCELGNGSPGGGGNRPHASEPLLPANDTDVVNGLASSYRVVRSRVRSLVCSLARTDGDGIRYLPSLFFFLSHLLL